MRLIGIVIALLPASIGWSQSVLDTLATTERKDNWLDFAGIGLRFTGAEGSSEAGLYGQWMVSHQRELGSALTAFGPELALSAVFTGDRTYRRGTVGLRAMHLFYGAVGPCGGISFDNISYRASLDDTRLTLHAGITLIDFVTVEYARSTPLTSTMLIEAEDLLLVRVGLNGAVLMQLFERVPLM